mmetsp:Transcript_3376/g.7749  ORF Transcript_3376/g.7749 Transcript_3376/m.7749 type:complete len:336 (-) Transcript_3376:10-1017(-)
MKVSPGLVILAATFPCGWVFNKFVVAGAVAEKFKDTAVGSCLGIHLMITTFAVFVYPAVPFIILGCGGVHGQKGFDWTVHAIYAILLVSSAPMTSLLIDLRNSDIFPGGDRLRTIIRELRVPIFGCQGCPSEFYAWFMDLLFRGDQYTDAVSICIAYSVGFPLANPMLCLYIAGFVLQPAVACVAECCGKLYSSDGDKLLVLIAHLAGASPLLMNADGRALSELVRTITESIPQPFLQYQLSTFMVKECGTSSGIEVVYISMGISAFIAAKNFFGNVFYVYARLVACVGGSSPLTFLCSATVEPEQQELKPAEEATRADSPGRTPAQRGAETLIW